MNSTMNTTYEIINELEYNGYYPYREEKQIKKKNRASVICQIASSNLIYT